MNREFIYRFKHIKKFSSKNLRSEFINSFFQNDDEPIDIINGTSRELRENYYNLLKEKYIGEPRLESWENLPANSSFSNIETVEEMLLECALAERFIYYVWPFIDDSKELTKDQLRNVWKYEEFEKIFASLLNGTSVFKGHIGIWIKKELKNNTSIHLASNEDFANLLNKKIIIEKSGTNNFSVSPNIKNLYNSYTKEKIKRKLSDLP